jgi:predicted GNAT family acetyltransferase
MASVRDNKAEGRYELDAGGHTAVAYYQERDGSLIFTHTEVPRSLRGQGIGSTLIEGALDDARTRGLSVVPACSFVRTFIDEHPSYRDLLA